MKIKVKECFSGPDHVWEEGDVVETSEAEGKRLISLDLAEPAKGDVTNTEPERPPELKIYGGNNEKPITWAEHLAAYKKAHPELSVKDAMKGASESFKKVKKSTVSDKDGKRKVQTTSIS